MTTRLEPRTLLDSWNRLAAAETEAIESGNWGHLATLQKAVLRVLDRLEHALEGGFVPDAESRSVIQEIHARGRVNLALSEKKQIDVNLEQTTLNRSRLNLRRQLRSFGHAAAQTWQRYS